MSCVSLATPGTEACDAVGGASRPQWREWPAPGLRRVSSRRHPDEHRRLRRLHYFQLARDSPGFRSKFIYISHFLRPACRTGRNPSWTL